MISTRKKDEDFLQRVRDRVGQPAAQLLVYENSGSEPLAAVYNRGLRDAENSVVVFMHDDVEIETPNVGQILSKLFDTHPSYGVIGLAGTDQFVDGVWWSVRESLYGQVKHIKPEGVRQNNYSAPLGNKLKNAVCVDGLFFAVHKRRIIKPFDEDFRGFHFYEIPFCVRNCVQGVGIGITTEIMVLHKSNGVINEDWKRERLLFLEKYHHLLPLRRP